jgi:hypothetical protein
LGAGVGALAFGATAGALFIAEPKSLSSKTSKILVSSSVALAAGIITAFIASYVTAGDKEMRKTYSRAEEIFKKAASSHLITTPIDSLMSFICSHYFPPDQFELALKDIVILQEGLNGASICLEAILERGEKLAAKGKVKFVEKCKLLLEKIKDIYVTLLDRKIAITREKEHEILFDHFVELKRKAETILASEQVASVNGSYEQTVAYGVSSVDEMWPLVEVVKQMRSTISKMNEYHDLSVSERELCFQKIEKEERYRDLVELYDGLIARIKNEFPFSLFEERIREIFSSEEYQKQGQIAEENRKHKEIMGLLEDMKNGIHGATNEVKLVVEDVRNNVMQVSSYVTGVNNNIAEINKNVSDVKFEVNGLKKDVCQMSKDVTITKNDVANMKWNVSKIKRDVSEIKKKKK